VELTCADPHAPCKLPNNFLADPPLKPVTSKTVEAGLRGDLGGGFGYSAAVFRTDLADDIQFVSSGEAINAGFFQNVGDTRRDGVELGLTGKRGRLDIAFRYSYVHATFRSPFTLRSPNNAAADASGDIQVELGNHLPGIPHHTIKLGADCALTERLSLGMNIYAASGQYARGDENNLDTSGRIAGYTVLGLDGRYQFAKAWRGFFKISNLTNKKYDSLGVLGKNFFRGAGQTFDAALARPEQFRSRGPPRGVWAGVEYQIDALK
jgi:outer membrane receptor protein involved in Fe transport